MMRDFKAIVVGGGPIGVALALALARIAPTEKIALLDALPERPRYDDKTPDMRVFAINEGSKQLLNDLGGWAYIEKRRCQPCLLYTSDAADE